MKSGAIEHLMQAKADLRDRFSKMVRGGKKLQRQLRQVAIMEGANSESKSTSRSQVPKNPTPHASPPMILVDDNIPTFEAFDPNASCARLQHHRMAGDNRQWTINLLFKSLALAIQRGEDMVTLDLPAQFDRKAKAMLLKVAEGRAAHAAKNIKASGKPFEDAFRAMLSESLPATNRVASGYFYGADSKCSAEVDVLLYEDREAFRLDPAPQDQHYVPYSSVSVIGQVKNSAKDLDSAIFQAQTCLRSWHEMLKNLAVSGQLSGQSYQEQPLTFVACAECSDSQFEKIAATLRERGRPYVDYILLLDRGEIIAGNLDVLVSDASFIDFLEYGNVSALHLCKPDGEVSKAQGLALMWFYFALVSKLNFDHGNNLRYHGFCRQISMRHPLRPLKQFL